MVKTPLPPAAPDTTQGGVKPWELQAIMKAHLLHGQLQTAMQHAKTSKLPELRAMNFMAADSPYMVKLAQLYSESLALAKLLDSSDLLLHAEGPGAADHSPRLGAVNWLCNGAEKHIKSLMGAMLPMAKKTNKMALRDLDLRLTGLVPGSLYAGFALAATHTGQYASLIGADDTELLQWLRSAMHALPVVPQYVGSEKVDRHIMEALPDPALRDAALVAAYELSPTGNKGIHTVEISAPLAQDSGAHKAQPLGLKERVVLREAIRGQPMMRQSKHGSFVGVLRGIDLDTQRISVRHIGNDIDGLRGALLCDAGAAKLLLDRRVRITGDYESSADGRPRMMRVERIEAVERELPV